MRSKFLRSGSASAWTTVDEVRPGDWWLRPGGVFRVTDVRREGDELVVFWQNGPARRMDPKDEVAIQKKAAKKLKSPEEIPHLTHLEREWCKKNRPASDYGEYYHGTSEVYLKAIKKTGLKSGTYVTLDESYAWHEARKTVEGEEGHAAVGGNPIVIVIDGSKLTGVMRPDPENTTSASSNFETEEEVWEALSEWVIESPIPPSAVVDVLEEEDSLNHKQAAREVKSKPRKAGKELPLWDGEGRNGPFPGQEPGGKLTKIKQVPLVSIEPTEDHVDEAIVQSLMDELLHGEREIPALIVSEAWTEEGSPVRYDLIDGHHRYEAAKRLGYTTVPVRVYYDAEQVEGMKKQAAKQFEGADLLVQSGRVSVYQPKTVQAYLELSKGTQWDSTDEYWAKDWVEENKVVYIFCMDGEPYAQVKPEDEEIKDRRDNDMTFSVSSFQVVYPEHEYLEKFILGMRQSSFSSYFKKFLTYAEAIEKFKGTAYSTDLISQVPFTEALTYADNFLTSQDPEAISRLMVEMAAPWPEGEAFFEKDPSRFDDYELVGNLVKYCVKAKHTRWEAFEPYLRNMGSYEELRMYGKLHNVLPEMTNADWKNWVSSDYVSAMKLSIQDAQPDPYLVASIKQHWNSILREAHQHGNSSYTKFLQAFRAYCQKFDIPMNEQT